MAVEDFTTYTEVDPNSHITITDANTIDFAALDQDETAYVYRDLGAAFFDGDFEHLIAAQVTAQNSSAITNVWAMTNSLNDWQSIKDADVLMIPIGGKEAHNTMDETEALQVVKELRPKIVIPCHYNLPALFTKEYCKADEAMFKAEVEKLGTDCRIMKYGDAIAV